jgi:hypothetical protein
MNRLRHGVVVTVAALVVSSMPLALPQPPPADAAPDTHTVTLRVTGCKGCRIIIEPHGMNIRAGGQTKKVRLRVDAGERLHVFAVKRGTGTGAATLAVWRYRGFQPEERVTVKKLRQRNPNAGRVCSPPITRDRAFRLRVRTVPTTKYPGYEQDPLWNPRSVLAFVTPTTRKASMVIEAPAKRYRTPGVIAVQNMTGCR